MATQTTNQTTPERPPTIAQYHAFMADRPDIEAAEMTEARSILVQFAAAAANDTAHKERLRQETAARASLYAAHIAQVQAARQAEIKRVQQEMEAKRITELVERLRKLNLEAEKKLQEAKVLNDIKKAERITELVEKLGELNLLAKKMEKKAKKEDAKKGEQEKLKRVEKKRKFCLEGCIWEVDWEEEAEKRQKNRHEIVVGGEMMVMKIEGKWEMVKDFGAIGTKVGM